MKINNIILVLRTRIILSSSFVIYFFCICHSGRFPIKCISCNESSFCLIRRGFQIMEGDLQYAMANM